VLGREMVRMCDSFVFYKSFYDSIEEMDEKIQYDFLNAIIRYAIYDDEPQISGVAKALFTACKPQIDANKKRREDGSKGGEYGYLGGRPKKNPNGDNKKTPKGLSKKPHRGYDENPIGVIEKTPNVNVNVNENENVNVNDNVNDNDYPTGLLKDIIPSDKGLKKKDTIVSKKEGRIPKEDLDEIIARWNTLPEPVPRLTVVKPGSKRYESLSARIDDYGIDNVMIAIEKVRKSSFLCGKSSNWHISFDWFVLPNNFPKVLDGNYTDSEQEQNPKSKGSMVDEWIEKGLLPV
jgi:hypothetical protein